MSAFSRDPVARHTGADGADIDLFRATAAASEREVGKVIVGQEAVLRGALIALLQRGHVLLAVDDALPIYFMVRAIVYVSKIVCVSCPFTQDKREQFSGVTRTLDANSNVVRSFSAYPGATFG